jgi:hypothetical protein
VDFNDPNRPKTCLEVDFPILPVNQVAIIEGNAGKPIYQMSKWWARRRSSVFRSMLIAAATKAPDDPSHAAKRVWDHYYANHQSRGAFRHLKVADIFMGGGTTLVEGSRLGMQMVGNDLNPVAWFVVKQELANVDLEEVKRLLADIEAEVKPQLMPYYYCDGPEGEKGKWTHLPTQQVMPVGFDPLTIPRDERRDYRYEGPEIIYTFWAKHGPCQVTGCGHRTPIMSSPVMAVKSLSVKHWEHTCGQCGGEFHVEEAAARMAPDAPLYVAPSESPYSVLDRKKGVICPHCGHTEAAALRVRDGLVIDGARGQIKLGKGKNKKVNLSLLVHPQWLAGSPKSSPPPPPPPPQPSPAGGGSFSSCPSEGGGFSSYPVGEGGFSSSPQRGEAGRGEMGERGQWGPVSWGRMRREVMADVRQLQAMLENHAKEGLPAADIQVIRRGKALEYFSRHYGKVYVDEGRTLCVREALLGINQLIDEDADKGKEAPPVNAEPITRQFLRTFGNAPELKRDQLQKFLKGSITTPDEFVQRGWCVEKNKVFTRTDALDFAREWAGKHKRKLTSDLDQALVLIGACVDGSGIHASDTLKNEHFKPHVALKALLEWLQNNGPDQTTRFAASRALSIFNAWRASQAPQPTQSSLFDDDGEYE